MHLDEDDSNSVLQRSHCHAAAKRRSHVIILFHEKPLSNKVIEASQMGCSIRGTGVCVRACERACVHEGVCVSHLFLLVETGDIQHS